MLHLKNLVMVLTLKELDAYGLTGYLTGSVDSWGDSKHAELRDRVKHDKIGGVVNDKKY